MKAFLQDVISVHQCDSEELCHRPRQQLIFLQTICSFVFLVFPVEDLLPFWLISVASSKAVTPVVS